MITKTKVLNIKTSTLQKAVLQAVINSRTLQRLETGMMDLEHTKFINYCKVLQIDITALMRRQRLDNRRNSAYFKPYKQIDNE